MRRMVCFGCLVTAVAGLSSSAQEAGFESLGQPIRKGGLMGVLVGPGPVDGSERIYFNMRQDGGKLFLVAYDPVSGTSEQFNAPVGTGAWGLITGPDSRIYLGTHEGPDAGDSGQILVFDAKHPEQGIQVVGRPSASETYLWMFTIGHDGKLYGCTFGNAKLVSYDPKTSEMADLGVMDETQKYTRSICTGPDGRIYLGVGYGRANVVVYDPSTGEHKGILPEEYRRDKEQTVASVYAGTDGKVYISAITVENGEKRSAILVVEGDGVRIAESPAGPVSHTTLADGRSVRNVALDGAFDLVAPDGATEPRRFTYECAGAGLFMMYAGPLGRIYGGSAMPNEMFWYDPATGQSENPGNPTETGGEIYSMLDHGGVLYACAYPGSFLAKWDPTKPWNKGVDPESNPRMFGNLGPGHLRPRAMIHGPDDRIYIGSYPEYGMHGGSLGVWDPVRDVLVENYHPLIANQSIVSLAYDQETRLVFGGSSIVGGGGTTPVEPEAKFFAFDAAQKKLVLEEAPIPGAQDIRILVQVGRRIFGIAAGDTLFVYDIDAKQYVHKGGLGVGYVPDCCLGLWTDGKLYGLSSNSVFRLDPGTFEVTVLASYPGNIHCGFAMDTHGIYFGDRATLMRYRW